MATDSTPLVSETLLHKVQATALELNREPADVLEEEQPWTTLVATGQENARRLGLQESDVERLVSEYRREKRE